MGFSFLWKEWACGDYNVHKRVRKLAGNVVDGEVCRVVV